MSRNPPPPRRMVHSVMSEMRDKIDLKLKGKATIMYIFISNYSICILFKLKRSKRFFET